ncbi:lipoprotein NlpI [Conservatibacter flavescens]|uniref:Lipoprotein NlpI n=1 Tax=Conservatibacter flavescens TaxID=28161 RepID=A0A2M8S1P5_9PAST|nr:lipoprotein NlpI [Conservatibacter flavescens]PJG85038.1 lipoprotein NlpI [Conservatibacter flavescens]
MAQLTKLFNFVVLLPSFIIILLLSGCVNSSSRELVSENNLMLAEQQPNSHFDQEVMIVRISQILLVGQLSKEERAGLHFERGVLYDSLGLWALARYDFTHALALQPKMAAVYNYLGLYLLLDEDYEGALEAFNAVFELDPSYEYTHLNRGLNFYYTKRYNLAQQDLETFFQQDQTDPYRALWLYLNEIEFKPNEAKQNLAKRAKGLSREYWGSQIVEYYLGNLSLAQLKQSMEKIEKESPANYPEILTETYFYLAKQKLNTGHIDEAKTLFKLAMANRVYNFVEYRFALFELSRLRDISTEQAVVQQ